MVRRLGGGGNYIYIAGKEEPVTFSRSQDTTRVAIIVIFIPYYVLVVGLSAWSASTKRLSSTTGLDWEVYWLVLIFLSVLLLVQALMAVVVRADAQHKYGWTAFGMGTLSTMVPLLSDPFDTLKDAIFGGLCLTSDLIVVQALGVFSWVWLFIIHVILVMGDDTIVELRKSSLSVYLASFDRSSDLWKTAIRTIPSILFQQTTDEKLKMILCEDGPQAFMALVYWFASPNSSPFIMVMNLALPILRVAFAKTFHDRLRGWSLVQEWLGNQVSQAVLDGDAGKLSKLTGYLQSEGAQELLQSVEPFLQDLSRFEMVVEAVKGALGRVTQGQAEEWFKQDVVQEWLTKDDIQK